jgi:hypothetical protein
MFGDVLRQNERDCGTMSPEVEFSRQDIRNPMANGNDDVDGFLNDDAGELPF